tara:strand:- start:46 stop:1125 length:1080 start_codon:yes stop_codon:yes gene_type:complete
MNDFLQGDFFEKKEFLKYINWRHPKGADLPTHYLGKVYGQLTVQKYLGLKKMKNGKKISMFLCKCSCGNTREVNAGVLSCYANKNSEKHNSNPHCNNNYIHFVPCEIGDKLGDLEVIGFTKNTEKPLYHGDYKIICKCNACGKTDYLIHVQQWQDRKQRIKLNPNRISSCGCKGSNFVDGFSRKEHKNNIYHRSFHDAKRRAKKNKLPFNLTKEYLIELGIPEYCPYYTWIKLEKNIGGKFWSNSSPSLDRIIPRKGYVKGNVQYVSWAYNCDKKDLDYKRAKIIANSLKPKNDNFLNPSTFSFEMTLNNFDTVSTTNSQKTLLESTIEIEKLMKKDINYSLQLEKDRKKLEDFFKLNE